MGVTGTRARDWIAKIHFPVQHVPIVRKVLGLVFAPERRESDSPTPVCGYIATDAPSALANFPQRHRPVWKIAGARDK
jgi:hypothetical protein